MIQQDEKNLPLKNIFAHLTALLQGQNTTIRHLLATLIAQGHVLLEDLPGTGKTTLAKSLANSLDAKFSRIQFTPDLMPSDITGTTIYNPQEQRFIFHKGAIFANVLLADEINRASPRTQSALLEAMEEQQISNEGRTLVLPNPFFVIATENPVEMHGTFPLPEAQLDRFMTKLSLGYVSEEHEIAILKSKLADKSTLQNNKKHIISVEQLLQMRSEVRSMFVSEPILRYIAQIVRSTRSNQFVKVGASARGSISLLHLSQAFAYIDEQNFVTPLHVQEAAPLVLAHRLILSDAARMQNIHASNIIKDVLNATRAPS